MSATEFDYVIVGAGSAGCVLANRLSENGRHSVCVVEAGGSDRRLWVQMPIGYGKSFFDPRVNWMYQAEPSPAMAQRGSYWPRGKVLGGSSSINAMVYVRGQPGDFDDWAAMGNCGWSWADVLPYFKKMETCSRGGNEYRGDQGPLHVTDASANYHPLNRHFIDAAGELGLPWLQDFNGPDQEGVGFYEITTRGGFRMSAARAYLRPALSRGNLRLLKHTRVSRICFEGRRASGIRCQAIDASGRPTGQFSELRARREVILCAGAIGSPQLLQLSGVGPAEILKSQGVDVVQDNPWVGRNLQDHLAITHYYRSKLPTLNQTLNSWVGKLGLGLNYLLFRRGLLSIGVNQAGGFFRSNPQQNRPNLQFYFAPLTYTGSPEGKRPLMHPDRYPAFLNSVSSCRPKSRGYLQIQSSDVDQPPRIYPNYLDHPTDVQELLEGVRFLRKMAQTEALGSIIEEELQPGIARQSNAELIEDIRRRSDTVFHPSGTCKMGNAGDSVVDNNLCVHNLVGLRVVDASIFPSLTSGNTNAPTLMVAEKAADLIARSMNNGR